MSIIRSLVVFTLLSSRVAVCEIQEEFSALDAQDILSRMTVDQKIGQLFIFGFSGQDFSNLKNKIDYFQPGAIILFGRNIKSAAQVLELNSKAQKQSIVRSGIPLIIAVDQEGGTVSRIRSSPPQPSALAIGHTKSKELSERIGFYTGRLLKSLNFNLNLAPVVDIADPSRPSFLGTRSFAGDAETVAILSSAFSRGLQKSGVMATLKHFPGHGNERVDPHFFIPEIFDDLSSLEGSRLKPFREIVSRDTPAAVMVAHLAIPNVDPEAKIATYSHVLIQKLLREKWKYEGIVLTDDIDMAAAKEMSNGAHQAVLALNAGVDMVMVAWNRRTQKESVAAVKQAIKNKVLSMADIDQKVLRILKTKIRFGLFENQASTMKQVRLALRDPNLKHTYNEVTLKNLEELDREPAAHIPTKMAIRRRFLVMSRSKYFMESFNDKLSPRCCHNIRLLDVDDVNHSLESQKDSLAVIHVSGKDSASIANRISAAFRKRVIIVNTNSPSLILAPESYARTVNTFTYHPELGGLIAERLLSPYSASLHLE